MLESIISTGIWLISCLYVLKPVNRAEEQFPQMAHQPTNHLNYLGKYLLLSYSCPVKSLVNEENSPKFQRSFLRTSSDSKDKRQKDKVSASFSEAQGDRTLLNRVIPYTRWVEKILLSSETSSCVSGLNRECCNAGNNLYSHWRHKNNLKSVLQHNSVTS